MADNIDFKPGDRVRFVEGPHEGKAGTVIPKPPSRSGDFPVYVEMEDVDYALRWNPYGVLGARGFDLEHQPTPPKREIPRNVIEFVDHAPNGPAHKTSRVLIDGREVLVAENGVRIVHDLDGVAHVHLELLPTQVLFHGPKPESPWKVPEGLTEALANSTWEAGSGGLLEEPEPEKPVIQGGWTLRERKKRQPRPVITGSSITFHALAVPSPEVTRLLYGDIVAQEHNRATFRQRGVGRPGF